MAAGALVTGERRRDATAHRIMEANKYSEIRFVIDSLTALQPGDTLTATAVGTFELRGVHRTMAVPVKAWPEAGGLRIVGQFHVPADDLTEEYGMSRWKLGLGVVTNIWQTLHMGIDVVLKPVLQ